MKSLDPIAFDPAVCRRQLKKLQRLLQENSTIAEKEIQSLFRENKQLAALMGTRFPYLLNPDRIAFEYDLLGDFACDVVIGNSKALAYCFVEVENASATSIFRKHGAKSTPEWASPFEHGFSQIVDWLWKLDEMSATDCSDRFGGAQIIVNGLLVVGRDLGLAEREQRRLRWRLEKVLVDSHHVHCVTLDEVCRDMERQLREYQ